MSAKINKNGKEYDLGFMPKHYPADRVYLDGDINKTVQDALTWKLVGTVTDHNAISIPTVAREILCSGIYGNMSITFPTIEVGARGGFYKNSSDNGDIYVTITNHQLTIHNYIVSGVDKISNGVNVYYR